MTDAQVIGIVATVSIAFIAVLTGVLLNNGRLNDIKELLRGEIKACEAVTRADISELRLVIEKNHRELILKLTEMDNRLTRLEGERRVIT